MVQETIMNHQKDYTTVMNLYVRAPLEQQEIFYPVIRQAFAIPIPYLENDFEQQLEDLPLEEELQLPKKEIEKKVKKGITREDVRKYKELYKQKNTYTEPMTGTIDYFELEKKSANLLGKKLAPADFVSDPKDAEEDDNAGVVYLKFDS